MQLRRLIALVSILLLIGGCQTLPHEEVADDGTATARHGSTAPTASEQAPGTPDVVEQRNLWERVRQQLTWQTIDNDEVSRERNWYLSQHSFLPVINARAELYLYHLVEAVEARNLPIELALLPVVESNLDPFAVSPSHAAGIWQIMPSTGRHLGLRQDWWYDGRLDLRDSTSAALDYLEDLYVRSDGDWLLALAAYNAGKARVGRAQRLNESKGLPTDFWSIKLPRETRRYVPRLIALSQILAAPEKYAIDLPALANEPAFEPVDTGGQVELARVADMAGIEISALRALNPGQLRWASSPDARPDLLVPIGTADSLSESLASLEAEERVRWNHYEIQRGDSLIRIAGQYDTSVALLREVNGIKGSRIRAGDTLLIPRGNDWAESLAYGAKQTPRRTGYRVRPGDSLYRIAGRFNVSIGEIVAWNALNPRAYLHPGQKLTLYVSER